MTNNDFLRSLRYLLNVGEGTLVQICRLAECEVNPADIAAYLKRDDEVGYLECPDKVMAPFLNGMVVFKRGKDPARPPQPLELPVTNNGVLKKVRVAFELKDSDIIALIESTGLMVSKPELNAFFRRPEHRNYRACGDQFLRNLFKSLGARGHKT
jgi:uncharacterized protein YehS (DUF1456 family)